MNELTLTQLAGAVGLAYTLWQISGSRAQQAAELAELRTKVSALEAHRADTDRAWARVEANVNNIATLLGRLEERLEALSQKIDAR